jgi:acetyl-CoA/propionyl-CoA carboxylase carboxyl transferase subunit
VTASTVVGPAGASREVDPRDPAVRLGRLLDAGPIVPLHAPDASGVRAVRGRIAGRPVYAYCTDATTMGGALGAEGCGHIVSAIDAALRDRVPVVGLWHSGGARLADGVQSLDAVGRMFAAMTRASGRVFQLSVVLGPAAGGAAYGAALTDLVVMGGGGRMFVTGPDVVRAVTGERVDMEALGGGDAHGRRSGVAHQVHGSEGEALAAARRLVELVVRPGILDPGTVGTDRDPRALLPESPRRAYDVRPLVRELLDTDPGGATFEELQPKWAPNIVIGLGRLAGRAVGVVANNPLRKAGCLDSLSAEKASRFVRMCSSLGVPLVVLADVPGYLPGVGQEWGGVIRRGAKLLHAFAESAVPRVTLITRKSYGGAHVAMNARALGATAVFAWPGAEVAVMSTEAAVGLLHRKALAAAGEAEREPLRRRLAEEHARVSGGVARAVELGLVDEVIEPRLSRLRVAEALAAAPAGRGHHNTIPL